MIDYLGDVGAALERGDPAELQKLDEQLRLGMTYHADEKAIDAAIRLGRDSERVRGRSCTLITVVHSIGELEPSGSRE
jgi:hypothetical protein